MSIANKLIYLNGTKEKLKDSINNIGGSITDETTFRAYAEELDAIYDNLPKTTGEGSNLSLTTLKGRINVDDILGDTKQEGTPTPSSPQDINVVTGQQEVLVRGKNLFDGILELGLINGNTGLDQPNSTIIRDKNYIQVEGNTQYVISTPNSTIASDSVLIYEYKADYSYNLTTNIDVAFGTSWTTKADTKYIRFRPRYATTDTTIKFMVEKGTTASEWQPYQEQTNIVNLSSKNKCNLEHLGLIVGSNGTISSYANAWNCIIDTRNINSLYISGDYTLLSDNALRIGLFNSYPTLDLQGTRDTFNVSQSLNTTNCNYVLLCFITGVGHTIDEARESFMVNEGNTALPYEPYYNYELCKIGTYQDRIFKTSGKNLFDKDNANIIDNAYIGSTNISAINGAKTLYIECEPNTTYTISRTAGKRFVVAATIYEPQLNTSIGGRIVDNEASSITITTNSVAKYLCVFYYLSGTDTLSEETIRNSIMINEGSTALPYEPYGSDKWYIEKNIGKYTFTGSETYTLSATANVFYIQNWADNILYKSDNIPYCTCYSGVGPVGSASTMGAKEMNTIAVASASGTNGKRLFIKTDNYSTTTAIASGNKDNIVYYLIVPTYEEITNTTLIEELNELEKIMSYNGQTNISVSGNLPMIINVTALKGE